MRSIAASLRSPLNRTGTSAIADRYEKVDPLRRENTVREFVIVVALMSGMGSGRVHAQATFYETKPVFLPDMLREVYRGGAFVIEIDRGAATGPDRSLIEAAESAFPSQEVIDRAIASLWPSSNGTMPPPLMEAEKKAAAQPGNRWWWQVGERFYTPLAVTGASVRHYVERMRILAADPLQLGPYAPPSGTFRYTVRVVRTATGTEVILELQFKQVCGRRCGTDFTHRRKVYFDSTGKIARIEGDGIPQIAVS